MYNATIARIQEVRAHPNADKIQLATVLGEQVVVDKSVQVGDMGIYFPVDGQLSHDFCYHNNLYNKSAAKSLGLLPQSFGFFDRHRRIRAQSFRGQKSEGFWIPIGEYNPLAHTSDLPFHGSLVEGFSFTEINGHPICSRYETAATRKAMAQNGSKRVKRGETRMFPKHYDTDQFRHKWEEIPEGSIIYLTEKLHGTSGRYGYVKDEQETISFGRKMAEKFLAPFGYRRDNWTYLNGTRNVITEHSNGSGFYGDESFRTEAVKNIKLRKGEVLYFELVGDVKAGTPIMPDCAVDKKELPDIYGQYGPMMRYRYGCNVGENKLFVYRITLSNEDGEIVELSWPQVKKRCKELNLQHCPEIGVMQVWDLRYIDILKGYIEQESHGPSLLDPTHIREGVAIRIETPEGRTYCLKEKSFEFKFLEGIVKSKDEYVDMEESS